MARARSSGARIAAALVAGARWLGRAGAWCAAATARFLRTTWRRRASAAGGARLALVAALSGVALGYLLGGDRYHLVYVGELALPKPVTPPPAGTRWVEVLTTGYCPCQICCPGGVGITACGRDVRSHPFGIASDPATIPYGLTLDVPGYGRALVDDTGGAMRQDARLGIAHLDLRFTDHREALRWGRRRMWIAVPR